MFWLRNKKTIICYTFFTKVMKYSILSQDVASGRDIIPCTKTDTVNSEIFARILFSGISVKIHICDVKYMQLENDLTILVNNRVSTTFRKGLIFTKLRLCKVSRKLNSCENFRIYSSEQLVVYI